ncbi:MAG: glycosyltransferase family 4 protein [Acidobacteriia bacterium]|nr:glycosyltransferase family 4 protein [Terriglobia bacterium]
MRVVMHLTDSLDRGGMERVAVNLANELAPMYRVHLCATRRGGPLSEEVDAHVHRLVLHRKHTLDAGELLRFSKILREQRVEILHAHGSSIFFAAAAAAWARTGIHLLWHCHYGRFDVEKPSAWLYRHATRSAAGVITVNEPMAEWSRQQLRVPGDRVWYVPNFATAASGDTCAPELPGASGRRIVCVANLRRQKDHVTLLLAIAALRDKIKDAHLLVVGGGTDVAYQAELIAARKSLGLRDSVTFLGERRDAAAIVRACDVAVLSSVSEGLPLSLLEYGAAARPVVCTSVGQCPEVLGWGEAGILVPPGDPGALARALTDLLEKSYLRRHYGEALCRRVERNYSKEAVLQRICAIYDLVCSN